MKTIKIITFVFFVASVALIATGLIMESSISEKLIGSGVVVLFVIVFPLFSYYRWKDRSLKDYMLTKENLEKMREHQRKGKY
jgi:membrane protein YdbS with pleckstrin-like domain